MNWIRERVLSREVVSGTWLNLGSCMTAEIAARAGFDWVVLDIEHGAGDHESLLHQLQAVSGTPTVPLARVAWNELPRFKRVLDLGASGVVVPYVTTPEEARAAVAAVRYPPQGMRGVASMHRGCGFGEEFAEYMAHANERLLTVCQVETEATLGRVDEIAAVDGVDVLFVGPMDLSWSMGIAQQYEHPRFLEALQTVSKAARDAGKAAGILLQRPEQIASIVEAGFTFIGLGSDGGVMVKGMRELAGAFGAYR